jgi:hypothetical protein
VAGLSGHESFIPFHQPFQSFAPATGIFFIDNLTSFIVSLIIEKNIIRIGVNIARKVIILSSLLFYLPFL